ncbi:hypothetical protein PQO03_06520 [Lentisphaera profundi]|uniref:CarD-like/TRCF RNAP-interacting domain-containing protein n=1 Tax=Lentisphaera profundi TaxID=1658616 RepID=A0ABY7VPY7_9BACT|nr:hypothetical protein [Lentisphaera profundi]WDE95369.1 hypothetical protein PQO03_06520 [Lentisphaera profundi]
MNIKKGVFSKAHGIYFIELENLNDAKLFFPPSKIKGQYAEEFIFDYNLNKELWLLQKQSLEKRLQYLRALNSQEAKDYVEALTGSVKEFSARELELDMQLTLKEVLAQLEDLNLYSDKYIILAKTKVLFFYLNP